MMPAVDRPGPEAAGLRAWARGTYPDEAAAELLIRAFGGRFATRVQPWVVPLDGSNRFWCDPSVITEYGSERRVLAVVAGLLGGDPVDLVDVAPGLDRANLTLVLAAIAHAGGSHQHTDWRTGLQPGPIVPWPDPADPHRTPGPLPVGVS
jgi:hypothetical protein